MEQIPYSEIAFQPSSFADPSGRLFWWKGELYRGIAGDKIELYQGLFDDGTLEMLIKKGLVVDTEITPFTINEYKLVLKHGVVPFVSYAYEWCPQMVKDAGLALLDLQLELAGKNLTLQDAHPWNVLFDWCKPVYVDLGSIVPAQPNAYWPAYDEFCRFFLYPLRLMSRGHGRIARWLVFDNAHGVLKSDLDALTNKTPLGLHVKKTARKLLDAGKRKTPTLLHPPLRAGISLLKSMTRPYIQSSRPGFLKQVRRELETITLRSTKTEWTDYYERNFPTFSPSSGWTAKHHGVYKVLSDLRPKTVLDFGSNRGWYSQLASLLGSQVVAFDVEEASITQLYNEAKAMNLQILPLIMDFRFPTPAYGLSYKLFPSAAERLQCDMVLALGLTHHLVFKRQLNFHQLADGLSIFSKGWLLVEFVPREDQYVREWWSEKYSWYTLDNFVGALKRHFRNVAILPSSPEPRVLLLCEK